VQEKHDGSRNWFKLADYEETKSFDLFDWHLMLSHRFVWRIIDLPLERLMPRHATRAVYWRNYLEDVLPCRLRVNRSSPGWDRDVLFQSPSIEDMTEDYKGLAEMLPEEVEAFGLRILAVNTSSPDTVLKKHFEEWLKEQRRRSPLPAKRRGRQSANFQITKDILRSWTRHKVLAILDLDFHAQVFEINRLTHEEVGGLLETSGNFDPKEWGRAAREKADEAIACVYALHIQTKQAPARGPK
jgi:hypothetical protein